MQLTFGGLHPSFVVGCVGQVVVFGVLVVGVVVVFGLWTCFWGVFAGQWPVFGVTSVWFALVARLRVMFSLVSTTGWSGNA